MKILLFPLPYVPTLVILEAPSKKKKMIDASTRLRRAIHLNDLTLLKRIIKNNPRHLQNPDFADHGNTSLHLAAQLGLLEIAVCVPRILSSFSSPSSPFLLIPHHLLHLERRRQEEGKQVEEKKTNEGGRGGKLWNRTSTDLRILLLWFSGIPYRRRSRKCRH